MFPCLLALTWDEPGVADLKPLMCRNLSLCSREAESPVRMEAIQALSNLEDNLGVFSDYVRCNDQSAKKERSVRAERIESMCQFTLKDCIVGIPGLIENFVTAFITAGDYYEILRTDNRLVAML